MPAQATGTVQHRGEGQCTCSKAPPQAQLDLVPVPVPVLVFILIVWGTRRVTCHCYRRLRCQFPGLKEQLVDDTD